MLAPMRHGEAAVVAEIRPRRETCPGRSSGQSLTVLLVASTGGGTRMLKRTTSPTAAQSTHFFERSALSAILAANRRCISRVAWLHKAQQSLDEWALQICPLITSYCPAMSPEGAIAQPMSIAYLITIRPLSACTYLDPIKHLTFQARR